MKILLDTHIALWLLADDPRLSNIARVILEDITNELYISTASVWEIAIKNTQKPESMKTTANDFVKYCDEAGIISLPIKNEHVFELGNLKHLHNDPFDRLLMSQAISEGFTLMTHDSKIINYNLDNVLGV